MEIDIPQGTDRYKHFAFFIMDGVIFPNLAQFKHILLKNPASLIKTSCGRYFNIFIQFF